MSKLTKDQIKILEDDAKSRIWTQEEKDNVIEAHTVYHASPRAIQKAGITTKNEYQIMYMLKKEGVYTTRKEA